MIIRRTGKEAKQPYINVRLQALQGKSVEWALSREGEDGGFWYEIFTGPRSSCGCCSEAGR